VLTVLENRESKVKAWVIWGFMLAHKQCPLAMSPCGGRDKPALWVLSYRALIIFIKALLKWCNYLPKVPPLVIFIWAIQSQYMNLGENIHDIAIVVKYIYNIKITIILSVQFSGIQYISITMQPSLLFFSRLFFNHCKLKPICIKW
jgi:hypothetical protein